MHGPFQGIRENLAYMRFVIPIRKEIASHRNLPSLVWMTQQRAPQERVGVRKARAGAVAMAMYAAEKVRWST